MFLLLYEPCRELQQLVTSVLRLRPSLWRVVRVRLLTNVSLLTFSQLLTGQLICDQSSAHLLCAERVHPLRGPSVPTANFHELEP